MAATSETAVWRRYDAGCFDGGTIGGRGLCSVRRCDQTAAWMREQRDSRRRRRMYAYCQEHRDASVGRPRHAGQHGCGCHVELYGGGRAEIVNCATHNPERAEAAEREIQTMIRDLAVAVGCDPSGMTWPELLNYAHDLSKMVYGV